jgi:hypothetical protein
LPSVSQFLFENFLLKGLNCSHKTNIADAKLLCDSKTNKKISSLAANNVIKGGKASWDFYFQLLEGIRLTIMDYLSTSIFILIVSMKMLLGMAGE